MPASRQARTSVDAASSRPVIATSVVCPPSATTLLATFAAPPIRYMSWSCATTGTGASGEMRVTRPTMNLSSMASPITSTCALLVAPAIRRARSGVTVGSSMRIGSLGGEGQCDDHEEQRQEFRVAEVVLEHAGREHRRNRGERAGGEHTIVAAPEDLEHTDGEHGDESEPHREGRQTTLRGDLNRDVVQVRVHLLHTARIAVLRVETLDHVGTHTGEWVVLDHFGAGLQHRDGVAAARIT